MSKRPTLRELDREARAARDLALRFRDGENSSARKGDMEMASAYKELAATVEGIASQIEQLADSRRDKIIIE